MSMFNPKFGATMNNDGPELISFKEIKQFHDDDLDAIRYMPLEDFNLSQTMEFSFEPMEVNFDALKEVLGAPSDAPVFIKYTIGIETQNKLHKKKRIAKKWAKQGKYKIIRKNVYAEVENIQAKTEEETTNYTMELVNEQAERIKQIREIFER